MMHEESQKELGILSLQKCRLRETPMADCHYRWGGEGWTEDRQILLRSVW